MLDPNALEQPYETNAHSFGRLLAEHKLDNNTVVTWLRSCGRSADLPLARLAVRAGPDSVWCPEGFSEPAIHSSVLRAALGTWAARLRVSPLSTLRRHGRDQTIYTVDPDGPFRFSDIPTNDSWVGGVKKAMKAAQPPVDLKEIKLPGIPGREAAKPRRAAPARRKTRQRAGREILVEGTECHKVPHNSPDTLIAQVGNSICIAAYKMSSRSRALIKLQMGIRPASDDELLARLDELFRPMTGYCWRFLIVAGAGMGNGSSSEVSAEDLYRYFSGDCGGRKRQAKGHARILRLGEQTKGITTLKLPGDRSGQEGAAIIRHLAGDTDQPEIIDLKSI